MASTSHSGINYGAQVGINYGTFTAEFHLPPERPETPPSPLSTVPFSRDPDFVSRGTLLDQINEKNSVPGSRIALVGLGGVGKSQLAIEHSYKVRSESPATWVFWVHASSEARFEQSFREIADHVKIPRRQDPNENIFKLVENWLRDEKRGKWVCILDNVDDDKLLCSLSRTTEDLTNASTKPLLEYIPICRHGSTIITSRSKEVALGIVYAKDLIEVQPMEEPEALELLQRTLRQPSESSKCRKLVSVLEFMPLAIVQAGSYIQKLGPRSSVSQYLEKFQGSDNTAIKLLQREASPHNRDWEAKNSILVTWQISFDHIRQTKPSAAELLSLMSFFDRQGIPENLIRNDSEVKVNYLSTSNLLNDYSDGEISDSDLGLGFDDDVVTLTDYSLISVSENSTIFTMHRLVQLATRAWLNCRGQIDHWKEKFISTLHEAFPTGEYENWERCRSLFSHVKSALSQQPNSPESLRIWATLLYRGVWYGLESGTIANVREMASKSMEQRVKLLGAESEEAIASTVILARAYRAEGQWDKARRLFLQVMESSKKKLGEDHPSTLTSMSSLALTYLNQGRWQKAERLFVQVVQLSSAKLGENHIDTLSSIANLASTYLNQGRWAEAEELFLKVMKTSMTSLGEDHPSTLASMGNLALTFLNQGRWAEAEKLLLQVIKARNTKLGQDHPSMLVSMANLAATYTKQGRWGEAEKLLVQVMTTLKTKLGEDHPDTLSTTANMASTYGNQGRWGEAEKLNIQLIETYKTKLGENHPDTLSTMANLASTYMNQDRLEEAEKLKMQVMETRRTRLGQDHPDTLTSMASLASTYMSQGRWREAENLLVQLMKFRKMTLGVDHPDTLQSMASLALAQKSSGQKGHALHLLQACLAKQTQIIGPNHPHTLASVETLLKWETEDLNINS
ncbi:hypothetical protein N7510_005363 [Penicillium lagena]|uniref:uncharacterized protein n=1 Tax=Penicillium lagena TaxID=94218 RepID=UPI002540CC00|nr:uncharacterized protein N7510_005363 [Penicillium lagena]KAJ5612169.1 hypothetical protein N7510_005363 [Penicillium lagena]